MLQSNPNIEASFPDREPINRQDFALRHLLLESIKSRLRDTTTDPLSYRKLCFLADNLSVERSYDSKGQFSIQIQDKEVLRAKSSDFSFFQKAGHSLPDKSINDPILEENISRANEIVEQLTSFNYDSLSLEEHAEGIELSCVLVFSQFLGDAKKVINSLLLSLQAQADISGWIKDFEIIIVDDCNPSYVKDDLREILSTSSQLKLINNDTVKGLGSSFAFGLQCCSMDQVLFVEALPHLNFRELERLIRETRNYEVVVPYQEGGIPPLSRRIAVKGWAFLTKVFFGYLARDIDSSLKLFSRSALERIGYRYLRGQSRIFNTEILARIRYAGLRVKEIPVQTTPHDPRYLRALGVSSIVKGMFSLIYLRYLLGVERLSWLGFVTGTFSRTSRPLEMLEYRRSDFLWDSKNYEELSCPICGASSDYMRKTQLRQTQDSRAKGEHGVLLCVKCRNGFTVPREAPELEDTLPDDSESTSTAESYLLNYFTNIRASRVLQSIHTSLGPYTILDVGGGSCRLGNELARRGHQVWVVDPHEEYSSLAHVDRGVEFHLGVFESGKVEQMGLTGKCDAVTFWHTLEHFDDPADAVQEALKALKPGGVLYICVPNLNSLQAEISRQHWCYLDVPRHRFQFSLDGLLTLLNRYSLEKHHVYWWSSEYEIFGFFQSLLNILSGSHNYYYNKKKKGVSPSVPYPTRNAIVHCLSFLFLPVAVVLSLAACAIGKPSCVELHSYKKTQPDE